MNVAPPAAVIRSATLQLPSLLLAAGAAIAMFRFKVGMLPTLGASALLGCGYFLLTG